MWRRALAAAVLAASCAAVSLAAARAPATSLRISGSTSVRPGSRDAVLVHAQSSATVRLAVYRAPGRCAARLEDELGHRDAAQLLQHWVKRSFAARLRLPRARQGAHHVCAYLYHRQYDNLITDQRSDFRYVAR